MLTGVDMDHPDIYPDVAAVEESFRIFLAGMSPGGGCTALHRAARRRARLFSQGRTRGRCPGRDVRPRRRGRLLSNDSLAGGRACRIRSPHARGVVEG
ncbi:MAG: hypothetical protein WKH64_03210 [Chloroflexia bacterium]